MILLILMALFAFKFVQKTQEIRRLATQRAALQYANEKTMQENAGLQRAIGYYRTPAYVENEARSVFGYAMPGDTPIIVQPVHPSVVAVRRAPAPPPPPPKPVWRQWLDAFFG